MTHILDDALYTEGPPWEALNRQRVAEPVVWQDHGDGSGFWAILRHADVVAVSRQPNLFSSAHSGVLLADLDPELLRVFQDMLLVMDPPRHNSWRRRLAPRFTAKHLRLIEEHIGLICDGIMSDVANREVDFVGDVCTPLSARVICELMGVPPETWPLVHQLAERAADGDLAALPQLAIVGIRLAEERRHQPPQSDLTSLLLDAGDDGTSMSDQEFGNFFVQLVGAGFDTTRTLLSTGLVALLNHPEQMDALRRDPKLIPPAVEELLRWTTPTIYMRRTATADTRIAGVPIREGETVVMVYASANRDEGVFQDPNRFDITRDPNPHLSFGVAEHFCLGAQLSRLESRVFVERLFGAFSIIELAGQPTHRGSNFSNGLSCLPVHLQH